MARADQQYEKGEKDGVLWEEVVTWYLEQKEDDLVTEEDFNIEYDIVNKVIYIYFILLIAPYGKLLTCCTLLQVIKKLVNESAKLIIMGNPSADTPDSEKMIAVHPGVDMRA